MSSLIEKIERNIEKKVQERMAPLAEKMDKMIELLKEQTDILKQIRDNTRK